MKIWFQLFFPQHSLPKMLVDVGNLVTPSELIYIQSIFHISKQAKILKSRWSQMIKNANDNRSSPLDDRYAKELFCQQTLFFTNLLLRKRWKANNALCFPWVDLFNIFLMAIFFIWLPGWRDFLILSFLT